VAAVVATEVEEEEAPQGAPMVQSIAAVPEIG